MNTYHTTQAAIARALISGATAFDHGEPFNTPADVRAYFALDNMRAIFGPDWSEGGRAWCDPAPLWTQGNPWTQDDLDRWAALAIDGGWHCAFASATVNGSAPLPANLGA